MSKIDTFTDQLLKKLTYHNSMASTEIAFENLKRIHPSLTETNPFALAYMSCNPAISEQERETLRECFKHAMEAEQKQLAILLSRVNIDKNDDICGHENSVSDEPVSNN